MSARHGAGRIGQVTSQPFSAASGFSSPPLTRHICLWGILRRVCLRGAVPRQSSRIHVSTHESPALVILDGVTGYHPHTGQQPLGDADGDERLP